MFGWLASFLVLLVHNNSARVTPSAVSHSTGSHDISVHAASSCTVTATSSCKSDGIPGTG